MEELAGGQYKVIWILSSFYPVSAVAIAKTTRMNDADICVMTKLFNYRPPDICRDVLIVLQPPSTPFTRFSETACEALKALLPNPIDSARVISH